MYLSGAPSDVTASIPAERGEEDWQVLNLPGQMEIQRALVTDYATCVTRWAETVSWMHDLSRMEAHVLDAGHLLLETHSAVAAPLTLDFIERSGRAA
ncbi:hypothetical protein ACI7YT_14605 [Microbacterium sp. M]|uniref:hypothetical protein n=1 Tax=Microbacterium sp. M TaxID=3377125 RepID=UPI00386CBFD3